MSDLTDAFMTAVAVAIFAKGTTIITGIANQHVKECDRIAAMCFNLNNIGITARNLKDGIEVDGIGESNWDAEPLPLKSAVIDCYDDHRIAMSFAVVAAAADMLSQGKVIIAIDDKACTAKTYPNFWDDITNGLGLICHGITPPTVAHSNHQNSVDASKKSSAKHWAPAPRRIEARKRSSIVIIGMRAAGKSTMGKALCEKLNQTDGTNSWKFLDLDEVLESRGRSVQQIVEDDGWEGFRQLETEILLNTIDQNKTNTVISCGGGVVETSEARNILKSHWPVLHLKRHIDDIVSHLEPEGKDNGTERRPNYGESIRDVWKRRLPMFNATSTHQFTIIQGDTNWSSIQNEFVSFALTITRTTPIEIGRKHVSPYKSFVCLTLPDLSEAASNGTLSQLCAGGIDGCDAVELRVDLLKSYDTSFVYDQLAILRRALPSSETGIIYTVRTEPEGGRFPIEERAMFELLSIGGRAGCEMVDVESRWSRGHLEHYLKDVTESQPHVAIIASMHAVQQPLSAYNDDEIVHLYEKCGRQFVFDDASLSQAVVCVKMVGKAEQLDASARIHAAARRAWSGAALSLSSLPNLCGLVGICTQKNGSLSRVLNSSLGTTPVTSDLLSEAAAPGQITQQHIKKVRIMLGLPTREDAKRYCLFGTPISTSPSPTMHNTGFLRLGLPHFYDLCETDHLGVVQNVIKSANFGGASVTIPLKEKVIPMMDQLSDSAKAIGAVNTIVKKSDGVLFGDNTDWIGMRDAILNIVKFEKSSLQLVSGAADQRLLSSRSFIPLSGLVVGAGGTARAAIYCLQQMRCPRIVVHNRTHSKALKLAKEFGVEAIESISSNEEKFDVILCTVPSSAQFKMPQNTWENKNSKEETKTGGSETTVQKSTWPRVVLDAAYRPRETSLIRQARLQSRGETLCVEGIDMLIMQGLAQLRRWTNINDLTDIVRDSIQKNVRAYYKQSSA
jgi:pentafunctional AROM polypeptide